MLCKSQHCLSYVEKCEEVLKCIEMTVRLIISGSVLHAIDVTEHTLQMSFLYNVAFMHTPQRFLNSQMNMRQEQFEISLHLGYKKTAITIGLILVFIGIWMAFYPVAVMIWWRDKYLSSSRNFVTYTLSVYVPSLWVRDMKSCLQVVVMVMRLYFNKSFPFALLIIFLIS